MKKIILLIAFIITTLNVFAQEKSDVITMLSGEKKEGKVTAVKDDVIKFVYKGETLEYEFKKAEIAKIQFSSGRTEVLNTTPLAAHTPMERKGKIAVLPFGFITNENSLDPDAMGRQIQKDAYNSLKENTNSLQLQDPLTTNSLLAEEGITSANISSKQPKDIAVILGVEYVVYGSANVTNKGSSTYGSGFSTYNGKDNKKTDGKKEQTKSSGTGYSSSSGTTITNYETKIDLNFYNDEGNNIYSGSRNAFGNALDAYHATISYLIKRCPFGSKAKN